MPEKKVAETSQAQPISSFPYSYPPRPFTMNPKPQPNLWSEPPILPLMPHLRQHKGGSQSSSALPLPRLQRSGTLMCLDDLADSVSIGAFGKDRGFDLFSPAVPETLKPLSAEECLPAPAELDYRLDFLPFMEPNPTGLSSPSLLALDFTALDSSDDVVLGAIPLNLPAPSAGHIPPSFDFSELKVKDEFGLMSDGEDPADMKEDKCFFQFWEEDKENIEMKSYNQLSNATTTLAQAAESDSRKLRNGKLTVVPLPSVKFAAASAAVARDPFPTGAPDDLVVSIGEYTKAERRRKIQRFKQKQKNRTFTKKIIYKCRQSFAQSRPRVGGRFVSAASA